MEDATAAGFGDSISTKPTSITVSGVGKSSEQCKQTVSVPGVLEDGTEMTYEAPYIPNSSVPALCGLQTLDEHNMGVLPWSNQLVRVPKGQEQNIVWPQGTSFIQCHRARTGHMMLPIGKFNQAARTMRTNKMTFATKVNSGCNSKFPPHRYTYVPDSQPSAAHE